MKRSSTLLAFLACFAFAGLIGSAPARALTQGEAIVNAAASMSGKPYCWDGGNEYGPTHGAGNVEGATQCGSASIVGFDCTGLTQYAAYQGTGGAVDLTHHNSEQAKYAPGEWITSEAALQPGDIVYFGSSRNSITHAAIYAGVSGGQQMIWDANTAFWIYPDGVHERTLASENSLGFVGAARVGHGTAASDDPVGSYDSASSPQAGVVRIGGWAFDPDAKTSSVTIHAYVGAPAGQPGAEGHNLGPASGYRPDVGRAYPGVGDYHGFDFTFETSKVGSVPVCVYAINIGAGGNVSLGCKTITIANPNPTGSYDSASSPSPGTIRIGGWAFDMSAPTSPVTIHAYIGAPAGQPGTEGHDLGLANRERADVGRVYPGVGNNHGFDFTFETQKVGSVPVCVYAINIGVGTNVGLGCKTVTVVAKPPPLVAPAPSSTAPAEVPQHRRHHKKHRRRHRHRHRVRGHH